MASSSTTPPSSNANDSSNAAQSIASSVELFKPSLPDIGWKYNSLKNKSNIKKVTCDYCLLESTGGISRAKQHQGERGKQGEQVSKGKGKKVVIVDEYDPEFITDWGDEEKEEEEEENEEKEDEAEHMNDGESGSYDEDFHDY